jgi:hypothetical protein
VSKKSDCDKAGTRFYSEHDVDLRETLESVWELGRIAGLREAAKIERWWDGETSDAFVVIRDLARKLAKKSRAK